MVRFTAALALAAALSAPVAAFDEPGTHRPGATYSAVAVGDPASCRVVCGQDHRCRSWAFIHAGVHGPNAICELKSAVMPARANPCCTSGVSPNVEPPLRVAASQQTLVMQRVEPGLAGGRTKAPSLPAPLHANQR